MELYRKYRPSSLDEVVGQPIAVKTLQGYIDNKNIPHCMMFYGPSGTGKTSLARIMCAPLGCSENDFMEINCADFRGIDDVRDIRRSMSRAPMHGKCRVWLVDESHRLTKDAQEALLKMTEDTPRHVYFMFATTAPASLLPTLRSRFTKIEVKVLSRADILQIVKTVAEAEEIVVSEDVIDKIATVAEGNARTALTLLNQIVGIKDEEDQLAAIAAGAVTPASIEIARVLMNPRADWATMSQVLRGIEEDPEDLRRMVLGYAAAILVKGGRLSDRAFLVIDVFGRNFFDSGRAGLIAACYEVITAKSK